MSAEGEVEETTAENQPLEEPEVSSVKHEGILSDDKPQVEPTTNASVLSASDIRDSVDDTIVEPSPNDAGNAENGSKSEVKSEPAVEQTSNGTDDWEDILGNGQLMKKVGVWFIEGLSIIYQSSLFWLTGAP